MSPEKIIDKFRELFHDIPDVFRSPGRINLIGEHTDYNDGFVLPAAIDKEALFALKINASGQIRIFAFDLNESHETPMSRLSKDPKKWPDYLLGVTDQFIKSGIAIPGFDCVFGSDIPIGSGLSSSAAIECGLAFALNELLHTGLDKMTLARLGLRAEQEFAGLNCGIMDQFTNLFGKQDHVMKLDCRSLEYRYIPLNLSDHEILLCDTRVKHTLASSEYNTRREECEQGVKILTKQDKAVLSLRDAGTPMVKAHKQEMPANVYDRCLYVTEEIERVEAACNDLESGNLKAFGARMYLTHEGLSQLYKVSCPELDFLVDLARENGVTGSRMMGGGFGGCTINIIRKIQSVNFTSRVTREYQKRFGKEPGIYRVGINNGTSRLS